MSELTELERRISAALDRVARAAEALPAPQPPPPSGPSEAELALHDALAAERATNAQMSERLAQASARQEARLAQLTRKLERAHEQLDQLGYEMQGLRRANARLAEANALLVAAQEAGAPDLAAATAALQAELAALRAARRAEMAELEEVMAELAPLAEAAPGPDADRETAHG